MSEPEEPQRRPSEGPVTVSVVHVVHDRETGRRYGFARMPGGDECYIPGHLVQRLRLYPHDVGGQIEARFRVQFRVGGGNSVRQSAQVVLVPPARRL